MQIVTSVLISALTLITGAFLRHIGKGFRAVREDFATLKEAQCALLRDRIVQGHEHFVAKQSIGTYSLSSINNMYQMYKQLGGNGFVDELMEEIRKLPIN